MIQIMLKWVAAVPLILRVCLLGLFSTATLQGQGTNAISITNLLQNGWSEFSSNNYVEAGHSFRAVIATAPTNAEAYAGLGRSLNRLQQYPEAITNLERALALQPDHTNWWLVLGSVYLSASQPSNAIRSYRQHISLWPNNARGYARLSSALYSLGKYDEAVSTVRHALALDPTNHWCYAHLGFCLEQLNHHDEALQALHQAMALDPKDEESAQLCAYILFKAGRLKDATAAFEKVYSLNQNDSDVRQILFGLYLATFQCPKAYQLYPTPVAVGACILMLVYLTGLGFLLPFSFRVRSKASPGIWFTLTWLAAYVEGQVALFLVLGLLPWNMSAEFACAGMILASIPVLVAGALGFRRQPWGKPFAWPLSLGTKKTMLVCLFGLILVWLLDWVNKELVERITHHPSPVQEIVRLIQSVSPLVAFPTIVILLPLAEEILFRGLLQGALEKRLPVVGSIIITALVFALYHCQLTFLVPLFGIGVLLGWARAKSGSIGLPFLIHALNNGLALLMVRFTESGS